MKKRPLKKQGRARIQKSKRFKKGETRQLGVSGTSDKPKGNTSLIARERRVVGVGVNGEKLALSTHT